MALAEADPSLRTVTAAAPALSLLTYWTPRYWPAWLLVGWMRIAASLPWRLAIRLHKRIGLACYRLMPRHRRIVERNVALCFPDLDSRAIDAIVRGHFENLGACLAETARAWFGKAEAMAEHFIVEGDEHVYAALARGKGVILYTGHFTPVEICVPALKQLFPLFGFMFRLRRNALLDEFQRRGRADAGHLAIGSKNVRAMLRALERNAVVWYAPDQCYSSKHSIVLPFFGEPATVSTATCRIARASGAAIVPLSYRRLPDESAYILRFEPAVDPPDDEDEAACTARLVGILESQILACPEQYAWTHRRLKSRTAETPDCDEILVRNKATGVRDTRPHADRAPRGACSADRSRNTWTTALAIVGVALFIAAVDNGAFLGDVYSQSLNDKHQFGIVLTMFTLVAASLVIVLSLAIGRHLFRIVAAILLVTAAAVGYFMSNYGVIVDPTMIRNVVETDVREASPLITPSFLLHVAMLGLIPAAALFLVPLGRIGWRRELATRTATILGAFLLSSGVLYANYGPASFFGHQNHALRMEINPAYPLYSVASFALREYDRPPPIREQIPAQRIGSTGVARKPTLFIFVMGETARADRFSLNGYERDTNRFTSAHGVINFPDVSACGTSTADSVPCIFSNLGHADFSHAEFARMETLFGLIDRVGVDVHWRDNSTGCKDICSDESFEDLAGAVDPDFCHDNVCIDEILLSGLADLVDEDSGDHFVVLHQRGSHGPAYYLDTPPGTKAWLPECDSPSLQNCDAAAIGNAYDNTILYTDYFLARLIEFLQSQSDTYETAMLYVSDHGESLGERGLYLHGIPYALAPPEQTKVPMLFWGSTDFYGGHALDPACLRESANAPTSHDAVFHSLLSIFDIASTAYDGSLDLFASCRRRSEGERLSRSGDLEAPDFDSPSLNGKP